jgi:hypothetical protein
VGGAQTMYAHVSKCKNDKIKGEKKKKVDPENKATLGNRMLWIQGR